ncbi:MAG: hypothetical protein ACJAZT_002087 [Gammaproteobacteria bacterium]|jgi:hypothetical protein
MKVFYGVLAAIYISWFIWYGGSGEPVTPQELNTYISAMKEKSSSGLEKQAETEMLMRRLAEFDTGDEFLMINLMKYRKQALYPAGSPWSDDSDALAADSRYSEGVIKELLLRGSLPVLKANTIGAFLIDEDWRDWDDVAIVRYRSVKDMLDMIVGMADSGLATHKSASMEQTHVFPAQPVINLFSVRLLFALLLFFIATVTTLVAKKMR